MSEPSQVVVLAEDERHQGLVRRYLYRLGHKVHEIRFEPPPSGRGCGEQWVRDRYAKAVAACRVRSAKTALIVAIDADTGEVSRRLRQLKEALELASIAARAEDEAIIHLIPKRNVETWILCLSGRHVDEIADYRRERGVDGMIQTAALAFFQWSRPNEPPPAHCVPSLLAAIPEVRRLE